MSSAAVQPIQQPAQQFSSPARGPYAAEQSPDPSVSPASSRKQPKYSGGNGAPPNTPQLSQHYSPSASSAMTATPAGQRISSSSHATPVSRHSQRSYDAYQSERTDSQSALPFRQSQDAAASSPYSERQTSSRPQQPYNTPELGSTANEPDRTRENAGSTPAAAQSRRKDQRIVSEPTQQYGEGSAQRHSRIPTQSRSATAIGQPPLDNNLPREDSTVINRLVIADPQENVQREAARVAEARPLPVGTDVTPVTGLGLVGSEGVDDGGRGGPRSRQEHLKTGQPKRETKFGEYILGQTVGEGEFGKVKMGWKKEGGVQVAIKLIRRETLGNNPNRLPKIYREIAILRGLHHPNIVRLHEMVETERHIGIILEYASGGELFDYILNHRYLKDNAARRLFAQLVSGVGYLHKRGIVHRDLKLENLLLDRNRNIIITDFGFANTFNPGDDLGDEIEHNLSNKEFVQKMGLEQIHSDGHRRGDLMQTSCGSPCYAAPELVVSDSLYTGRKVDVWSCGVILYAMLAGYLPFDDDPANPEGDNINLLYKYIVSTPLTFPEYVTPHARDLLRRILVPDPRKRADLFEVARHSWLSEYAHVVGFITSSTTTSTDIANSTVQSDDPFEAAHLARSASVREPVKPQSISVAGPSRHNVGPSDEEEKARQRDAKRRTVQLEYVAPQSQTARGEALPIASTAQGASDTPSSQARSRARADSAGTRPAEIAMPPAVPPKTQERSTTHSSMLPPARPSREPPRAVSDSSAFVVSPTLSNARPSTRGSMGGTSRLPSRGNSYGQPAIATVAQTNVEGRFSQPAKSGYGTSGSLPPDGRDPITGRPLSQHLPGADQSSRPSMDQQERPGRGHKRTSTMESITARFFGRSNSTRRQSQQDAPQAPQGRQEKPNRAYPPVSMKNAMPSDGEAMPRPSTDSRRGSFGFSRKDSNASRRNSKRFSFLPQAFSRMSLSKESPSDENIVDGRRGSMQAPPRSRHDSKPVAGMAFGQGRSRSPSQDTTGSTIPVLYDSALDQRRRQPPAPQPAQRGATAPDLMNYPSTSNQKQYPQDQQRYSKNRPESQYAQQQARYYDPAQSQETQSSESATNLSQYPQQPLYPQGFNPNDRSGRAPQRQPQAVLQKNNRKFNEAYEGNGNNAGSSGGARRVMDWFRKRGKERSG